MIHTVDFFPPIVDDPFQFGQVAATNALSDVWAMGGTPKIAMNLLTFPSCLPLDVVRAILAGGYDKVMEAGAVIVGGHSIEDQEPKYGLCVTGYAHPEDILTNSGAQEGDLLVLTKPLGTGILSTAAKAGLLTPEEYGEMAGADDHPEPDGAGGHAPGAAHRLHRHHRLRPAGPRAGDGQGLRHRPRALGRRDPHRAQGARAGPGRDHSRRGLPQHGLSGRGRCPVDRGVPLESPTSSTIRRPPAAC